MTTITEHVNPVSAVAGGTPPGTQGQYIEDKKGECGLIIPAIDGINDLIDSVDEIGDNSADLDEYDDHESAAEDESAQEWAGR